MKEIDKPLAGRTAIVTVTGASRGIGKAIALRLASAGAHVVIGARNNTLLKTVRVTGTDNFVDRTCADHMLVLGAHDSGCISTLEVIGGTSTRPARLISHHQRGNAKKFNPSQTNTRNSPYTGAPNHSEQAAWTA